MDLNEINEMSTNLEKNGWDGKRRRIYGKKTTFKENRLR